MKPSRLYAPEGSIAVQVIHWVQYLTDKSEQTVNVTAILISWTGGYAGDLVLQLSMNPMSISDTHPIIDMSANPQWTWPSGAKVHRQIHSNKYTPRPQYWWGRRSMQPNITARHTAHHKDVYLSTKPQMKLGNSPQNPKDMIRWGLVYCHSVTWMGIETRTLWCRVKPIIMYTHGSMHDSWLNSCTCKGKSKHSGDGRWG